MACNWEKVSLGASGLRVSPLGLGSSYGLGAHEVERAFERGVNFLFWGLRRRDGFGEGITRLARRNREDLVVAVQSYSRVGALIGPSVESALRTLKIDQADLLGLGWWNGPPPRGVVDAALALKERALVRRIAISCHHRPAFEALASDPAFDVVMVRYNAAHPGAEREVFPRLGPGTAGVLAFTATRWGSLLNPRLMPPGEATPRASDCYRFALTNPSVHACLAGPRNGAELDEALAALDRGPMTPEELAWLRRVGAVVRDEANANRPIRLLDKAWRALSLPGT
ncbi:MAG: hypothetical protein HY909_31880 [Deltaproteobacteria bacterium]|nr:hypothetical protein [Deltaproteobacteria bacterium]